MERYEIHNLMMLLKALDKIGTTKKSRWERVIEIMTEIIQIGMKKIQYKNQWKENFFPLKT